jgi:hypothetical protein
MFVCSYTQFIFLSHHDHNKDLYHLLLCRSKNGCSTQCAADKWDCNSAAGAFSGSFLSSSQFRQSGGIPAIVGHTGREPVKLPFPMGCTTPVLGGLCVDRTTEPPGRTLRINDKGEKRSCRSSEDKDITGIFTRFI